MTRPAPRSHPDGDALRPRYGRIAAFSAAVGLTVTTLLGGLGVLPSGGQPSYAAPAGAPAGPGNEDATVSRVGDAAVLSSMSRDDETEEPDLTVPEDSGEGRRIVFDMSDQRVWLVRADGSVRRTYPVSGSIYDNLEAGTYQVYSRSENAIGIDDSGTMKYMVRFAHGTEAAIGFHDIPRLDGKPVQTRAELGTPLSHGCIRQARPDAKALWRFAPLGTTVVVVD